MFRIGLVDLDTSHPRSWFPLIDAYEDMEVVAVCDFGEVNPKSYVEEYAAERHIKEICSTVEEMVPLVDAAIIFSANWDVHIERALPFIEAGKAVLLDKPVFGRLPDIQRLLALQQKYPDALIMGGSSLRYASEIIDLKRQKDKFGAITMGYATGRGDFFSYGIHTIEMFQGFFGAGVQSVRYLGERYGFSYAAPENERGLLFEATYADGTMVVCQLCAPSSEWFLALSTEEGVKTITPDQSKIFGAIVDQLHTMLTTRVIPTPLPELLECIKVSLAAHLSRQTHRIVYLDHLGDDVSFDGAAYARQYRMGKWKGAY